MNPGDLNRRITIRRIERVREPGGGYSEQPVDVATVWAKVEPLRGREQIIAMQTGMQRPHRFTIRYRDGVTGAKDILYREHRYDIQSVVDTDAAHRELVILAEEVP